MHLRISSSNVFQKLYAPRAHWKLDWSGTDIVIMQDENPDQLDMWTPEAYALLTALAPDQTLHRLSTRVSEILNSSAAGMLSSYQDGASLLVAATGKHK